jgi:hypothetical protein
MKLLSAARTPVMLKVIAILLFLAGAYIYMATRVEAKLDLHSPLLLNTRKNLRICAQVEPKLAGHRQEIMARITAGLENVRSNNPYWEKAYGSTAAPSVESACAVSIPASLVDESDINAVGPGITSNPLPFRTVLVVVSDETASFVLGNRIAALVPYEMMKISDHEIIQVTSALIVRESALADPRVLRQYMPVAIGLSPEQPFEPPPGERSPTHKPPGYDAGS